MIKQLFLIVLLVVASCTGGSPDYRLISSFQDQSVPDAEFTAGSISKVLIIVPHSDDETIAGGLIALLNEKGAEIHLLTLCRHDEQRIQELKCSAGSLGIDSIEIAGFINNSWDDIMMDKITFWYDNQDSIRSVIQRKIDSFQPDILITYDSEIGGYGHPEHRISAQLTEQIFIENSGNPGFRPDRIFQITLSRGLEKFLVAETPGYELSRKLTGSTGLPDPDVAVDIRPYWPAKNKAAKCHRSQKDILKRFYIIYPDRYKDEHINAFSKEYYRIVER
jgi:LmbE family N-acetylglucosaminyl deacetylase